jgi:hypothetical protein
MTMLRKVGLWPTPKVQPTDCREGGRQGISQVYETEAQGFLRTLCPFFFGFSARKGQDQNKIKEEEL